MSATLAALLDDWAKRYEVESVLERVVGQGTPPACAVLAARGLKVVAVVDEASAVGAVQAAYGANGSARLAQPHGAELPKSDLVVVHGRALGDAASWRETLLELGTSAAKLLVVAVDNPRAWSARARALVSRFTHGPNGHGGWGRTDALAPLLWSLGRVREHAYLDVPPLGERAPKLAPRVAPRHVFVVDRTPRTPQARRRLRLST